MHFEQTPHAMGMLLKAALRRPSGSSLPQLDATLKRVRIEDPTRYAALCGYAQSSHLPLPFLDVCCRAVQLSVLADARFPFRAMGLVHVRQRIERHAFARVGDELSASVETEGFHVVKKGAEFDFVTQVRRGDALVWRGVTSMLTTAVRGDGVTREKPKPRDFKAERTETWALAANFGRRYAKVSHDYNPIHLFALSARLFGFSQAIMHGWWSLARCLAAIDDWTPERCAVEATFTRPLFLPAQAQFTAGREGTSTHFVLAAAGSEPSLFGTLQPL